MSCNDDFTYTDNSFMRNKRINNYLKLRMTKTKIIIFQFFQLDFF